MRYSVAMCTFNGAAFVQEQIESILAQTIRPAQIVVCDDRSQDNTVMVVKEIALLNKDIDWKIIENTANLGYVRNFEQAIISCDFELVFLSDQDDFWLPKKAEKIISYFETKPYSIVFTNAFLVDEKLNSLNYTMFDVIQFNQIDQKLFFKGNNGRGLLLQKNVVTGATMAFKKSEVLKYFPVPESQFFIHDSWIGTLGKLENKLGFINEHLILYRQHKSQSIGSDLNTYFLAKNNKLNEISIFKKPYRTKTERLLNILRVFEHREKFVLDFVFANQEKFSSETFYFLKKRSVLYQKIQQNPNIFIYRIFKISPDLYFKKIIEFQSFKKFVFSSICYVLRK